MLLRSDDVARRKKERGATLVEAALVTPLFLLLILGVVEVSLVLFNTNALQNGSRLAARQASASATDAYADFTSLKFSLQAIGTMSNSLDAIIIFRADRPSGSLPSSCLTALNGGQSGVVGECNIYRGDQAKTADKLNFGFTYGSNEDYTLWDQYWPPTSRFDAITETVGPDFVGVYVQAQHSSLTGLIPHRKMTATSVFQIEPQRAL